MDRNTRIQPAPLRRALFLRHPVASVLLGCPAAGAVLSVIAAVMTAIEYGYPAAHLLQSLPGALLGGAVIAGGMLLFPIVVSIIDFIGVFKKQTPASRRIFRIFAILTITIGILYSFLYMMFSNVMPNAMWNEQLYNAERHQPVWTGGLGLIIALAVLGLAGYIVLSAVRLDRLPPLVTALSIAAMYLGVIPAFLWCLQIGLPVLGIGQHDYAGPGDLLMCLLPCDYILLVAGLIRDKIHEWNEHGSREGFVPRGASPGPADAASYDSVGNDHLRMRQIANGRPLPLAAARWRLLVHFDNWLADSRHWPLAGLLLMAPLLGILLALLALFGQYPDRLVRAWTETADWGLSQKIPPQNAFYDEHYLCTVAAGGHRKIVRPMRYGERHGHRVVVNRQLCIANAFEDLLMERTPRMHRRLRRFYDTYGFPLSRLIRTKAQADFVWLLMKPLEWAFLLVLYLCAADPENRIAVQYMPVQPDKPL